MDRCSRIGLVVLQQRFFELRILRIPRVQLNRPVNILQCIRLVIEHLLNLAQGQRQQLRLDAGGVGTQHGCPCEGFNLTSRPPFSILQGNRQAFQDHPLTDHFAIP